jgi:hypothetical protein
MRRSDATKVGIAVVALAAAGGIWAWQGGSDEPGTYFYDLSEKKLYRVPRNTFAPHEGIGGKSGDGVAAIVVYCPECGREKQRIAYLKTHTSEYKRKREEAQAAGTKIEGLTRQYDAENTLVKLVDEKEWHKATSPEAIKMARDAKRRCQEHGVWEKPCFP